MSAIIQVTEQNDLVHEVIHLPFYQLCASDANVRQTPPSGIEALATNIQAEGILQNLIVSPVTRGKHKGKYAVAGGYRRWLALDLLVRQKALPKDTPVPCAVIAPSEAMIASLSENEQREPMHPADRFDAYKKLIDAGKSVEQVAAVFGVTPLTVQRYLKLKSISPKLFALFRQDDITLEQMQALTLADNHETQERVWFGADYWGRQPQALKRRLTEQDIDAERHPLARFVGLEAYEAAGGRIRRDLFSTGQSGSLIDVELLHQLAEKKLADLSSQLQAEGWGWVEVVQSPSDIYTFDRLPVSLRAPTPEEAQRIQALQDEQQRLAEQMDNLAEDETEQWKTLSTQCEAIEKQLDAIQESQKQYDIEAMKQAGALLYIGLYDGTLHIERGFVRRTAQATDAAQAQADSVSRPKEKPIHSETLIRRLLAHRTAALQVELANQPKIALAVLVSHLAASVFGRRSDTQAVQVEAKTFERDLLAYADDLESSPAWKAMAALREKWEAQLPTSEEDWLNWTLNQSQDTQLRLLAVCVALTVNGVQNHAGHPHKR